MFKKGDRIEVVTLKNYYEYQDYEFKYLAQTGIVCEVIKDMYPYRIDFDNKRLNDKTEWFHEHNLKLVEQEDMRSFTDEEL